MVDPRKKSQKMESLVKVRKMQFDQEFSLLGQLQAKSQAAQEQLELAQKTYIEGVEKLNRERQSLERKMLSALESAVDFSKTQWYQKLMVLRVIQEEEKRQMARVMEAQKRLRMLEKLDERYLDQSRDLHKTIEQKELDEFALQSSRRKVFS